MPKDRRTSQGWRSLGASLGLGAIVAAGGCRHTRPEVPPERPYIMPGAAPAADGTGRPHVGFSSEPPPAGNAYGAAAGIAQGLPGTAGAPGAPPLFSGESPASGQSVAAPAPPQPEPLQEMPGLASPPSTGVPPRGVMGVPGQPPSPY
jgi:hypothetical protein